MNRDIKDDIYTHMGEQFGASLARLLSPTRVRTCTIMSVDLETNEAYVTIYEEDEPMPVPLTFLNIPEGMMRVTPTVGSLALIGASNSDENQPFFICYSQVDKVEFFRKNTTITLNVDPEDEANDFIEATIGATRVKMDTNGVTADVCDAPPEEGAEREPVAVASLTKDTLHANIGEDSTIDLTAQDLNVKTGASTLLMNNDVISFNGGGLDGLVKINDITTKLNAFVDTFNSHVHNVPTGSFLVSATSGVPNPAPIPVEAPTKGADKFNKGDYENEKVKQ